MGIRDTRIYENSVILAQSEFSLFFRVYLYQINSFAETSPSSTTIRPSLNLAMAKELLKTVSSVRFLPRIYKEDSGLVFFAPHSHVNLAQLVSVEVTGFCISIGK